MVNVVYFSRSGNTKKVAEVLADELGVKAVVVDSEEAKLTEKVDILFVGGALYAYGLDKNLSDYLEKLDGDKVGKAVVFSTSWLSKHSIDLIKKGLRAKGIDVADEALYLKSKEVETGEQKIREFARKYK